MPNKIETEACVLDEELSTLLAFYYTRTHSATRGQTPLLRGRQPSLIRWSESADSEHKGVCLRFPCVRRPVILCDSIMNELVCVHAGI